MFDDIATQDLLDFAEEIYAVEDDELTQWYIKKMRQSERYRKLIGELSKQGAFGSGKGLHLYDKSTVLKSLQNAMQRRADSSVGRSTKKMRGLYQYGSWQGQIDKLRALKAETRDLATDPLRPTAIPKGARTVKLDVIVRWKTDLGKRGGGFERAILEMINAHWLSDDYLKDPSGEDARRAAIAVLSQINVVKAIGRATMEHRL